MFLCCRAAFTAADDHDRGFQWIAQPCSTFCRRSRSGDDPRPGRNLRASGVSARRQSAFTVPHAAMTIVRARHRPPLRPRGRRACRRLGRESQTAPSVTEGGAAIATGPFVRHVWASRWDQDRVGSGRGSRTAVAWLSSAGANACCRGRRSEGCRARREGPRARRCRVAGAAGCAGRPWRGRWELERAPGIHQWPAAARDAAREGRRLSVCCELGRCIRRCGRGDGGVQLAAPPDQARCLQRLGRPRPDAASAPPVERLPARGRRSGRGGDCLRCRDRPGDC